MVGCFGTGAGGGPTLGFVAGGPFGSTAFGAGAPGLPAFGGGLTSERRGGILAKESLDPQND